MLKPGLYEQVISDHLEKQLSQDDQMHHATGPIDREESSKILSKYVSSIIEKGLSNIHDKGGNLTDQINLINKIVSTIVSETRESSFDQMTVAARAEQLLALLTKENSIQSVNNKVKIVRPETSIAQTSLFTGAPREPQMFNELKKEITTCDRIDMLVSFIKWSGLRLIMEELEQFTLNGGKLRIITTSYMGATDIKAIEELNKLPNTSIKVSYDTKRTRLHAKTYVFYRDSGFTTAYVGSSNMSNAALSSGLEWNVKVTRSDLPETIDKIMATFESYWNSGEFEYYSEDQKKRLTAALNAERYFSSDNQPAYAFDIIPFSYQKEILDRLEAERSIHHSFKNLIIAATGTGKTVISAFDYKRFRTENPSKACRLLFIAHREEILKQSMYTFRGILKDPNFGEMFVGSHKPDSIDHLFMSIQTFNSQDFISNTSPDFYDYIVVDEFHHAAAPTYQNLLNYYNPDILLGLTATPERMDGKSILEYFDNRIAAEIRLPEAIDRKLLCPFQYFGVTDTIDLNDLKWSRGGYDKSELSQVYTLSGLAANRRADNIVNSTYKYVTDMDQTKGLGFCVSVDHAQFMSDYFNKRGIPSIFLTGTTPEEERRTAAQKLVSGQVKFIFVVDIYNEGVDIPEVNTVLFLRPTESLTIFLQQLGRGLRLSENKECLTVLDFIGQSNKKYNFENKFSALLSDSTKSVQKQVKDGFTSVPKGCYIQLEKKAKEHILSNIKDSFSGRSGLVSRIATFAEDSGLDLTLANFANYYHLDLRTIYLRGTFSRLCAEARVTEDFSEDLEDLVTKSMGRFLSIDSRRLLSFFLQVLCNETLDISSLTREEMSMLDMFQFTLWQKSYQDCGFTGPGDMIYQLKSNPTMCGELIQVFQYNYDHISFVDKEVDLGFNSPLFLHCTYTRDQLLTGLGFMKPATVREGVKYLKEKNLDIFFITLNKSEKEYSPTTMYNDYSINDTLFHWQSQSTTSEDSPTGQRYINHKSMGSKVMLFVRESKKDPITGGAAPYTFLGTASYLSHQGSRPMNITWCLDNPIPARFITKTNKMIAN